MSYSKYSYSITKICSVLATTLIVLKFFRQIDWSWSLVLSPIWIPISFALIYGILIGVADGYNKLNNE